MKSYIEAFQIIGEEFDKLKPDTETISIDESLHRTLAEDVVADVDLPPFDNSAMDGIAIKFNEEITQWKIVSEISAGNYKDLKLDEHSAVTIMTGSKLPEFCDTVIPVEDITIENDMAYLKENSRFSKGMNIRKRGSDLAKGKISVGKNTFILPKHLSTLASCGKEKLKVYKKLKIGVLATGDELIPITEKPTDDKIRISNTYSLIGLINQHSLNGVNLGLVKDNKELITRKLEESLKSDIDILLTTGGVSVGKYDYVKEIFEKLGVEIKFWKAKIKPGKPIVFGTYNKNNKIKLIFGLPGNPVSSFVNFIIFIRDNLAKLYNQPTAEKVSAILMNDLKKKDGKRHFMRGLLTKEGDKYYVTSQLSQSSGNLVELSNSNCLIVIEEDVVNPRKGTTVECIRI